MFAARSSSNFGKAGLQALKRRLNRDDGSAKEKDADESVETTGRRHQKRSWKRSLAPPDRAEVAPYLESFGYVAANAQNWEDLPQDEVPEGIARSSPWLGLGIAEHTEQAGHTWYQVECSLRMDGCKTVEWQTGRRLPHLRKLWYESIKSELGETYKTHFKNTPFAHRGGRRGTSARLNAWCGQLAKCVNAGLLSPAVVALTLRFLQAPTPRSGGQPQRDRDECSSNPSGDLSAASTRCGTSEGDNSPEHLSECEECDEDYESDFESDSGYTSEEEV
mmetsp:Transcript_150377/g.265376  ORF Transcript_150377/g.265376 Transcript_150377/m.265376 type:complete len:277 (-) Transcript_150377:175-1005(-)